MGHFELGTEQKKTKLPSERTVRQDFSYTFVDGEKKRNGGNHKVSVKVNLMNTEHCRTRNGEVDRARRSVGPVPFQNH